MNIVDYWVLALQTQADVATLADPTNSPYDNPEAQQLEYHRAHERVTALGEDRVRELLDV